MDNDTLYISEGAQAITPMLAVNDAAAAIDFYVKVFGAVEHSRMIDAQGKISHADLSIGPGFIMLAAGARLLRPIKDEPRGHRVAKIEDPLGHVWLLATDIRRGRAA